MGGTGDSPVPNGDSPLGRESGGKQPVAAEYRTCLPVSSGRWPDDTGQWPVLPGSCGIPGLVDTQVMPRPRNNAASKPRDVTVLVYKSLFLTRGEVWFDDEPDGAAVDWIHYRQRSRPPAGSRWRYFYTRLIDLAKSPDELLSEMDERTVRKIRAAEEEDKTRWRRCDPREPRLMDQVEEVWNRYAAARRSARLDREWLNRIIAAGALDLCVASDPRGNMLAYHLAYVAPTRVQQLISVSQYSSSPNAAMRNTINRANCLGHWNNMLAFKDRGVRYFDFGGWYPGKTDIQLLGMNAFKKGFGGQVVREHDCEQILTLKGWIVLTTARILNQVKSLRAGQRREAQNRAGATTKNCKVSPAF